MADHSQGEHKHGSMDIRTHEKTFAGFVRMSTWVVVICICVLIFMALTNA
jgi:Ni,Fe-hydrogenase I cytochrome b subunit